MPQEHAPASMPIPVPLFALENEDAARQRLRRSRLVATSMLAGMGVAYVLTCLVHGPGFTTLLIRSGAQAGMVGGLADWFAVTALFQHPLGLPIPHTAIIPRNKDRIGRAIGRFIERNFLARDVLLPKLREVHVGARLAEWLAAPSTAPFVAGSLTALLPRLLTSLRNPEFGDFVQRLTSEQIRDIDFAPMIARALRVLAASGESDILLDRISEVAIAWLDKNREQIDALVLERSRWWVPRSVDRRIARAIVDGLTEVLNGMRRPNSGSSSKFREAVASTVNEIVNSPEQSQRINAAMRRLMAHPEARAWLFSVANEACDSALDDLAQPSSRIRSALEKPISIVAEALGTDAAMQRHVDAMVERFADSAIAWRSQIGTFIAEVVRKWDTQTLTDRLELVVGSDLQFIRMNGTVVGALAGCIIFALTWVCRSCSG